MMSPNMDQERKRRGFISGLTPPEINDDYQRVKNYLQSNIYPVIMGKTIPQDSVFKITKNFYSLLFKLHNVYIMPEEFRNIFRNYMDSATKTTDGFVSLISKYISLSSPFNIPIKPTISFQEDANLLTYNTIGLEEERLPVINVQILMTAPTNLSPCLYAGQICGTQTDRIKGIIPNYHDQFVLSVLFEKILAYEIDEDIFPLIENYRLAELKRDVKIIEQKPDENRIWAYYISMVKAEQLFDYYVSLSDNDKKNFFRTIQRIFDGEMNLQELLNTSEITLESDRAIPAIKRNLALK